MKIIELKSSNIKKIKAVEMKLDENQNLILITGKNGAGKTSILDSIWMALGGKKAVQDKPIREGEEKGEIEINVDGYIVKRTFTEKGSTLVITNKDGEKYSNPQEFLNYIIGNLSFDPLEFSRMESKKQVSELINIIGLDFSKFDEDKNKTQEDRIIVGREGKALAQHSEEEVKNAEALKDKEEVSVAELSKQLEEGAAKRNDYINARNKINEVHEKLSKLQEEIRTCKGEILTMESVVDTKIDIDGLKTKINSAESENTNIREAKRILEDVEKVKEKKEEYIKLTQKIVSINEKKKTKLSKAKMPIKGLSWDEDKVLYNQIPYNQISAAEQLRVSMAIAMASNPKLKVILVRDGSLLDKDNMKVISEMAKDKDFQIFLESVDDSGKVGIYIEEGEIKKIN